MTLDPPAPLARARVLLVNDSPVFSRELGTRLATLHCDICGIVNNAIDALVMARSTRPDLALLEIILQGYIDGIQAARMLATLGVPVVYVSAHADADTLGRAASSAHYGFVRKPLVGDEFERTVTSALHDSRSRG